MDREQVAQMIREQGVARVAKTVADYAAGFVLAIMEGKDLGAWRVATAPGAILFWRVGRHEVVASDEETHAQIAALEAERERLHAAMMDAAMAGDNARRAAANHAAFEAAMQVKRLRERGAMVHEYPDQQVLCVNAPESARAAWEPVAAASDVPTILLMCPAEMPF